MSEVLIRCESVSKKFCRDLKRSLWYGVQDITSDFFGKLRNQLGVESRGSVVENGQDADGKPVQRASAPDLRRDEFWAVKDVSFELRRGESLGLIGRNGAGKTTLLKMLNGLIKPDDGRIEMHGRVGALIALGAGFNPILTGRENIYVNGSVLGLEQRHIRDRLDEIVDFAEIGDFIDAPVKTYSSGMQVRLGFSVAAVLLKPDILLLDEVLAVGDMGFTIKCLNAVRSLAKTCGVVFVSHNMQSVSTFCSRVMLLDRGEVIVDTPDTQSGMQSYFSLFPVNLHTSGTGEATLNELTVEAGSVATADNATLLQGDTWRLKLDFGVQSSIPVVHVVIYVVDQAMTPVICFPAVDNDSKAIDFPAGRHSLDLDLGKIGLNPGRYSFTVVILTPEKVALLRQQGVNEFGVVAERSYWSRVVHPVVIDSPRVAQAGPDLNP